MPRLAGFRSDEAQQRFLHLYDRVLEEVWDVPTTEIDVPTSFGTTRVHRCGHGSVDPVVLVHGHAGTSVGWGPIVGRLAADHALLVVDVIGALGRSVQTKEISGPSDLGPWFREVLDGLGIQHVHVVGFSEGGFVGFHATLGNLDRVASLAMIDSGGTIENVRPGFLASMVWAGMKAVVGVPGALRKFGERMAPGVEFPEIWWEMVEVGARGFRHGLPVPKKADDETLRRMTVPTLLLMAGASEVYDTEATATRARALMPDVEIRIVPGARHGLPFTHADETWPAVSDFVDRHDHR